MAFCAKRKPLPRVVFARGYRHTVCQFCAVRVLATSSAERVIMRLSPKATGDDQIKAFLLEIWSMLYV